MLEFCRLPESELDVMLALWNLGGEASAPEIGDALGRELTASALHSYLKRLEEKGFLSCRKAGKGHADGGAMGLAEDGKLQRVAMIKAAHVGSPFRWSSVFQNSGYDLDVHCAPRIVTGSRHPPARTAASIAIR